MRTIRTVALLAATSLFEARTAHAATTLVVPFAPGGGADLVAGLLQQALPPLVGETIEISHRPGDDGFVAVDEVARAAPDGRTLLIGSTASLVFAPLALGRGLVDPQRDLVPIGLIGLVPRLVIVHPSLNVRDLDGLIRLARAAPGILSCGTADRLSEHTARLFERQAGVRLDCTHYPGSAALRDELLSGKRKIAFESALVPEVKSGRLRAIAVAGPIRMRALPDVPTTSEQGLPGLEAVSWLGVFAAKGTDPARIELLADALAKALRQPQLVAALEQRGYVVRPGTPPQLRQMFERDLATWRRAPPKPHGSVDERDRAAEARPNARVTAFVARVRSAAEEGRQRASSVLSNRPTI